MPSTDLALARPDKSAEFCLRAALDAGIAVLSSEPNDVPRMRHRLIFIERTLRRHPSSLYSEHGLEQLDSYKQILKPNISD